MAINLQVPKIIGFAKTPIISVFWRLTAMFKTKNIITQLQANISGYEFQKTVEEHNGDKGVKVFWTINLLRIMIFAQVTGKASLRDICDSLKSQVRYWYHFGLESLSRNNLSHSLRNRTHKIFEITFYRLLQKIQKNANFRSDKRFRFKNKISSIDSTTISLCLSVFDWATFRKVKGGIKIHTQFDNRYQIPEFLHITDAKTNDVKVYDSYPIIKGSIYVMDRAYLCFKFLEKLNKKGAFFVLRKKDNTKYRKISHFKKADKQIKADWEIQFTGQKSDEYSGSLRLVKYYDIESGCVYEYLTNNFTLSAKTIADIYKSRWDIELFFKWIKQQLKVKTFFGTNENALLIQIWTAMITYLLIAYIRFLSKTSFSMLQVFRIIKANVFQNVEIYDLLHQPSDKKVRIENSISNQLCLIF